MMLFRFMALTALSLLASQSLLASVITVNTNHLDVTFATSSRIDSDPNGYTGFHKTSSINIGSLSSSFNTDGKISLPEAIIAANNTPGPDLIILPKDTYTASTINNYWFGPNALPPITSRIVIQGNGAKLTRDASAPAMRFFSLIGPTVAIQWNNKAASNDEKIGAGYLTLDSIHIEKGLAQGGNGQDGLNGGGGGAGLGGAIFNTSKLELRSSTLSENQAIGGNGGHFSGAINGQGGELFNGSTTPALPATGFNQGFIGILGTTASNSSQYGTGAQGGTTSILFGGGAGGGAASIVFGGGQGGTSSSSINQNGGGGGGALGGAIYNDSEVVQSLVITNSTLAKNSVQGGMGGNGGTGQGGSGGNAYGAALFANNANLIKIVTSTINENTCSTNSVSTGGTLGAQAGQCNHGVYIYEHKRQATNSITNINLLLISSLIANSTNEKNLASEFKASTALATSSFSIGSLFSLIENNIDSINGADITRFKNFNTEATASGSINDSNIYDDPKIEPSLQLNGGLTPNYLLQTNSPALAKGLFFSGSDSTNTFDQRGLKRSIKTPEGSGSAPKRFDIGSTEIGSNFNAKISALDRYYNTSLTSSVTISGNLKASIEDDLTAQQTATLTITGTSSLFINLADGTTGSGSISKTGTLNELNQALSALTVELPSEGQEVLFTIGYNDHNGDTAVKPFIVKWDSTRPSVTLSSSTVAINDTSTFSVTVKFSEDVSGFSPAAVFIEHATITGFTSVNSSEYKLILKPTAKNRTILARVNQRSAIDQAGLSSTASNLLAINYTGPIATEETEEEKKPKKPRTSTGIAPGASSDFFWLILLAISGALRFKLKSQHD